MVWKPDLENLCTETGPTPGTKKIVAPVISSTYQFAVNVNGIPTGRQFAESFMQKVTDKEHSKQNGFTLRKYALQTNKDNKKGSFMKR